VSRRIRHLRERLTRVERQREASRKERRRAEVPTVALVGYTNAGKTTLFNALSGAHLLAKDQLFATLDPTIRRLPLGGSEEVLVVDTVGFVRDLPHELVAAFRATLTETREAALLLHVIDASDPHHEDRRQQVETVLKEIGAAEVPCLPVYNKIDKAGADFVREPDGALPNRYCVSAVTGSGLAELRAAIAARVSGERFVGELHLGPQQSRVRAKLFAWHAVRGETADPDGGWTLAVELPAQRWRQLREQEGLAADGSEWKA
jgi:GTP-binding protein HflX